MVGLISEGEGGPASLHHSSTPGMQSFTGMNVDSLCAGLALDITAPVELAVASLLHHRLVRVVPKTKKSKGLAAQHTTDH